MTDATQPEKLDLRSLDVAAEQQEKLRQFFPEVFTEGGKIDFDRLKSTLGELVDSGKERFGMNWPGKAECFRTIQTVSRATLRPCREESVNFDTSGNLIIEGDNLEVLKLLQKGYLGQVKMIYIDPPYNTGSDLIYPDNFAESLDTYLSYTGQVDTEGRRFSTNPDTDGRFHSRWLNMMYPRLFLARNLMRDDGMIFVSIDNGELSNLKLLMNEIFGEENFLGMVVRGTGQTTGQDSGGLGSSFDYVLAYSKNPEVEIGGIPLSDEDVARFQEEDEKGKYHYWQLRKTGSADRREDRPGMYFEVKAPDGTGVVPIGPGGYDSRWRCGPETYQKLVADNMIVWKKIANTGGAGERWWPYVKYYLEGRTKRPSPLWTDIDGSKKATRDLKDLFGEKVFDNPKPIGFIVRLLQIAASPENGDIILDFFGGSGTTAQAVLEQSREDGVQRRFILVQLPEKTGKQDFTTIAEITKERVRRVIKRLQDGGKNQLRLGSSTPQEDLGFRVFKLDASNFKPWDGTQPPESEGLFDLLDSHVEHVLEGRSQEDILTELLLKSGFELSTKVELIELAGKPVFSVEEGVMLVCLDYDLTSETIKAIADKKPSRVICLDAGFKGNDQLKTNAVQTMKARGVLSFRTV